MKAHCRVCSRRSHTIVAAVSIVIASLEYPFWNLSFGGIWLIFLIGYFHFYVAVILVIGMKTNLRKILAISLSYSVPIIMNVIAKGIFHWAY